MSLPSFIASLSSAVAKPGLIAMITGGAIFFAALMIARLRNRAPDPGAGRKVSKSWLGVMTQGFAIALVGFGPILITRPADAPASIVATAAVAILMAGAVGLFWTATRTMGRNWSLVARTRSDHSLVTTGPFALMRHPIYSAMALFMFALAIAFGHYPHLLLAVPIFARGTWLRIREEEALLRTAFGADYDAYAARVKRFVPGLF